jgi:hypothetical protein
MGTLALILVPAALFIGVVVAVLALRDSGVRSSGGALPVARILLIAGLLVLGLLVAPRLLGFTFVFLPFLWIAGAGRRRRDG